MLNKYSAKSKCFIKDLLYFVAEGRRAPCSNEGEPVRLQDENLSSCFHCHCKVTKLLIEFIFLRKLILVKLSFNLLSIILRTDLNVDEVIQVQN